MTFDPATGRLANEKAANSTCSSDPAFSLRAHLLTADSKFGGEKETEELLAMHDRGEIEPDPIDIRPLPSTARKPERMVYDLYVLIRGLYDWAGYGGDVMLGSKWVAVRLGLPQTTTWRALVELRDPERYGVLAKTGSVTLKSGRTVDLYAHVSAVGASAEPSNVVPLRRAAA